MSIEPELIKSIESLSIGASSSSSESSSGSKPEKQIVVITSDDVKFSIDESVAREIETLKNIIEDDCLSDEISLPNIPSNIMKIVLDYCTKMAKFTAAPDYRMMKKFQAKFVDVDDDALSDMIMAADYLNIPTLFDVALQKVADRIRDMSVQEVRDYFGIETDIKPEDEDQIRRESTYCFE